MHQHDFGALAQPSFGRLNQDLERKNPLDLFACDGRDEDDRTTVIDEIRRNDERRPFTGLFGADHWIETNPHDVAAFGAVLPRHVGPPPRADDILSPPRDTNPPSPRTRRRFLDEVGRGGGGQASLGPSSPAERRVCRPALVPQTTP